MPDEAKWYVVHTYSGYENKVASNLETTVENHSLQDLIQKVCVPTELVADEDNKQKMIERKIFPGYVLIKMVLTDESWYIVRNIRGCTGFVGPSSKPIPLTEEEIARLGIETESETVGTPDITYNEGDLVTIIDGPFEGLEAKVVEVNKDKGLLIVSVMMFGRETRTEIEYGQVELTVE